MNLDWLEKRLQQAKEKDIYRELKVYTKDGIDFFSNDYLGLSKNTELLEEISKIPHQLGNTGSRLISGNSSKTQQIEVKLAQYYNAESSLYFSSGFMANLALFSSIATKHDTFIYDEYIHASAREGIRLSLVKNFSFKHNDYEDLEKKIKNATGNIFLAIEGIYSMDGDSPNPKIIEELVDKYNIYLIVDEAHSVGVLGKNGKGWSENFPTNKLFAAVFTFGKALGYHGAIITGSQTLIKNIMNFSKPFIYTTASPQHSLEFIEIIHQFMAANYASLIQPLHNNITQYNKLTQEENNFSPIQIIQGKHLEEVEAKLLENRIWVKLIKTPTVPKGKERIRICLHNFNTEEEIKKLVSLRNEFS